MRFKTRRPETSASGRVKDTSSVFLDYQLGSSLVYLNVLKSLIYYEELEKELDDGSVHEYYGTTRKSAPTSKHLEPDMTDDEEHGLASEESDLDYEPEPEEYDGEADTSHLSVEEAQETSSIDDAEFANICKVMFRYNQAGKFIKNDASALELLYIRCEAGMRVDRDPV
jgi:hypothetical protein